MITRTMAAVLLPLLGLTTLVSAQVAETSALPASLELRYTLRYDGLLAGRAVKTLTREPYGSYRHRSHSTPLGMAKMFTSGEWFEEGQFELMQGKVRPLSFLEYRVGANKPHRHNARFDWKAQKIFYENWPTIPLPPDTQDQGSILFALMLNPPVPGTEQTLHVSSGKKLRVYRYAHAGTETLKTSLGPMKTTVIERRPIGKGDEGFRVWLAVERNNLPVRISTQQRGQESTLDLESAKGL